MHLLLVLPDQFLGPASTYFALPLYCQFLVISFTSIHNQLDALKKMEGSRMGIYEHIEQGGPYIRLKELITDDHLTCLCPAGYVGASGELWYVRLLPSLVREHAIYWGAMTTRSP